MLLICEDIIVGCWSISYREKRTSRYVCVFSGEEKNENLGLGSSIYIGIEILENKFRVLENILNNMPDLVFRTR